MAEAEPDGPVSDTEAPDESVFDEYRVVAERPTLGAIWELIQLVRPYWRGALWFGPLILALGLAASLAEGAGVGVVVLLLSILLNRGAGAGEAGGEGPLGVLAARALELTGGSVALVGALAFAVIAARIICISIYGLIAVMAEARISHRVRQAIFRALVLADYGEISRRPYGDVLTILDRHSWAVAEATDSFANMALNACVALAIGGLLLVLAPPIALIALVGTIGLTFAMRLIDGPAERAGAASAEAARRVSSRTMRILQAMRTVRAFGRSRQHIQAFAADSDGLRSASMRSDMVSAVAEPASHVAYLAMLGVIALTSSFSHMSGELILAAVALLYRLQPYASGFEGDRLHLAGLLEPLRRVNELVALTPQEGQPGLAYAGLKDAIEFRDVTFGYPGQPRPCLRQASFRIPRGRWTMIAGDSGSGKSTVISLLLRFYAPQSGEVLIDGVPLDKLDSDAWLAGLAVAGQDVELVDGSIRENVLFGRPDADQADFQRAIRIAGLDHMLADLPDGQDTRVGERGLHLSGGQRQRIGIARAILRKPELLVLDEATGALDKTSEGQILAALFEHMAGRTVVIIGHHLAADLPIDTVVTLDTETTPSVRQADPG